jgi:hypothetical protein
MAKVAPVEGYRFLKLGEFTRDGDEVWECGCGPWVPIGAPNNEVRDYHAPFRRKVVESTKKPKEPATVNLPTPRVLDPIYHMPKSTPKKKEATMPTKKPATVKPKAQAAEVPYRPTIGDVVKVLGDKGSDHGYRNGHIGTLTTVMRDGMSCIIDNAKRKPWISGEELELVTKAADVVKATKEAKPKPKATVKPKYPMPREAITYGVAITGKTTKESIKGMLDLTIEIHNGTLKDLATTGTKLDRALVDLKEAKKRVKELEAAK